MTAETEHIINIGGGNQFINVPNICPYCNVTQISEFVTGAKLGADYQTLLLLFNCINSKCQMVIIAYYNRRMDNKYHFERFVESYPSPPNWPEPIKLLKDGLDQSKDSKFIKTYIQSLDAESSGLDEIAGMGYRKAIEYLVKDLAVQKLPADVEKIKGKTLASVVSDYFSGDLKEILQRAVWLGNDQTHYYKIFDQFDINMLKDLIDFVLSDLDREYKKQHYNNTIKAYNQP